jgi:hypothetical protein
MRAQATKNDNLQRNPNKEAAYIISRKIDPKVCDVYIQDFRTNLKMHLNADLEVQEQVKMVLDLMLESDERNGGVAVNRLCSNSMLVIKPLEMGSKPLNIPLSLINQLIPTVELNRSITNDLKKSPKLNTFLINNQVEILNTYGLKAIDQISSDKDIKEHLEGFLEKKGSYIALTKGGASGVMESNNFNSIILSPSLENGGQADNKNASYFPVMMTYLVGKAQNKSSINEMLLNGFDSNELLNKESTREGLGMMSALHAVSRMDGPDKKEAFETIDWLSDDLVMRYENFKELMKGSRVPDDKKAEVALSVYQQLGVSHIEEQSSQLSR